MAKLRLFAAITLTEEIKKSLYEFLKVASGTSSEVKWVQKDHLHLTLVFLGDQDEGLLPVLMSSFQSAAEAFSCFRIKLGGLGAFPNLERPKVLFTPLQEGMAPLLELAKAISIHLKKNHFIFDEKEFHAHVTIGRVKAPRGVEKTVQRLEKNLPANFGEMDVKGFTLFKSRLTSEGPIYQDLRQFSFRRQ